MFVTILIFDLKSNFSRFGYDVMTLKSSKSYFDRKPTFKAFVTGLASGRHVMTRKTLPERNNVKFDSDDLA